MDTHSACGTLKVFSPSMCLILGAQRALYDMTPKLSVATDPDVSIIGVVRMVIVSK